MNTQTAERESTLNEILKHRGYEALPWANGNKAIFYNQCNVFIGSACPVSRVMNISSISIVGKEWFRKSAGNSYQSCKLEIEFKDGSLKTLKKIEGGYGDYYNQMALDMFLEEFQIQVPQGYNGREFGYLSSLLQRTDIPYMIYKINVTKEKDL